jgi:hypothetical protein
MCLYIEISEPEKIEVKAEHLGFKFIVIDSGMGFRCGYVEVPPDHPWYRKHYDEIKAQCHGGLTFSEMGRECLGRLPEGWWIGFDCGHFDDGTDWTLSNGFHLLFPLTGTVRTREFVEAECRSLCEQAQEAANDR